MGRYIACLEACSHMQDFKQSVANVARHAMWRNYPPSLISSVWSRFLHKRWQSADIRGADLLKWFRKMLQYLRSGGIRSHPPDPRTPQPPISALKPSTFLQVFGREAPRPPSRSPHATDPAAPAPTPSQPHQQQQQVPGKGRNRGAPGRCRP